VHVNTPERPGTVTHERPDAQVAPHEPQCERDASDTHAPEQHTLLPPQPVPVARFACVQPLDVLQPSVVHALPSSQLRVAPVQRPAEQRSDVVHALPSLHVTALFTWTHAHVVALNESSVHGFPSLHDVERHEPPQHV
jgi:hypothetical protein